MKVTENRRICFVLLFTWLLCSGSTLNWQGTGNFTQDNMTIIKNYINSNLDKSLNSTDFHQAVFSDYLADLATGFSNHLNKQWDKAWNVFVIYLEDYTNSDSVLYGYAFRSHWMWYNGIDMYDGNWVTLIIWKDYNCNKWFTFNSYIGDSSSYTSTQKKNALLNIVKSKKPTANINDIWSLAKSYVQSMENDSNFPNSAFSVIISQNQNTYYCGRFCAVDYHRIGLITSSLTGNSLIIQMR